MSCTIPKEALESFARAILPDIIAFYETEEGQEYFAQWKAEREKKKAQKIDSEN